MSAAAETTVPRSTVAAAPFGMSWLLAATATAGVAVAPTRLLACFAVGTAQDLQDNPESDDCAAQVSQTQDQLPVKLIVAPIGSL